MKITLEFDDDDCTYNRHLDAINGMDWKMVVSYMDEYLRRLVKYPSVEEKADLAEEFRSELWEYINGRNLYLD